MTAELIRVRDEDALLSIHAIMRRVQEADAVDDPAGPVSYLRPWIDDPGPRGGRVHEYYLGVVDGVPVGVVHLGLSQLDNLDLAEVEVSVDPPLRRRGHGRSLAEAGRGLAIDRGRKKVLTWVLAPWPAGRGAGEPLASACGLRPVLEDVRRALYLDQVEQPPVPEPPPGYELHHWVDRAADELVDGLAGLRARMTIDPPMGELDYEPEVWDAQRYREQEQNSIAGGLQRVACAVRHVESGEVVAATDIGVYPEEPEVAGQWDTIVVAAHRGRRLGYLLKVANLRQLRAVSPATRIVNTWNAASNQHMVAINEQLGFRPMQRAIEYQGPA